ncbi:MAG: Rieske 2Fe-2S domain-containing protein, partial [Opitutaceae bacterium]|nr:Rieske 2Fe-2S domain-containing protein [Opitutaceae bacterium]
MLARVQPPQLLRRVDSVQQIQPTAPDAAPFAAAPASWYHLGTLAQLRRGPVRCAVPPGQAFVGFLAEGGVPAVISGRCAHMGADLACGTIRGGRLACPLHGWEYGADGRCAHMPAGEPIPNWARQTSFPMARLGEHVFFFNRPQARFPLPDFDGASADGLLAAKPF